MIINMDFCEGDDYGTIDMDFCPHIETKFGVRGATKLT